jgi:activating signal cointegrator complex subunit 3
MQATPRRPRRADEAVLRVTLTIAPLFRWNVRVHGASEPWWIWVEDGAWLRWPGVCSCVFPDPPFSRPHLILAVRTDAAATTEHMYHSELFSLQGAQCRASDPAARVHSLSFTIPIFEPLPAQYFIRAISDRCARSRDFGRESAAGLRV